MLIAKFKPEHLTGLALQDAQLHLSRELTTPGFGDTLAQSGFAFTALLEGRVLAVAGVLPVWENRAVAWALLAQGAGQHFLPLHRAVHGFLKQTPFVRVEAFVDADFGAGHRWMRMLGFVNETPHAPMRKYTPDGRDCFLFSRVK